MIDWKTIVEGAIEGIIQEFQAHPFAFVWEMDVQMRLCSYIYDNIPENERYINGFLDYNFNRKSRMTTAWHSLMYVSDPEYSVYHLDDRGYFYGRYFLDIGIWDVEHPDFMTKDYRFKPVRMGIELKINEEPVVKENDAHNVAVDVVKLVGLSERFAPVFTGYALWFLPNYKKDLPKRRYNQIYRRLKNTTKVVAKVIMPNRVIDIRKIT